MIWSLGFTFFPIYGSALALSKWRGQRERAMLATFTTLTDNASLAGYTSSMDPKKSCERWLFILEESRKKLLLH